MGAYLSRDDLTNGNLPWIDRGMGIGKGVAAGAAIATIANLAGLIGSTITKRRTEKEQVAHDARRHWEDWIIPGPAMYNKGKRLGRSEGDYEEHPETHDQIEKDMANKSEKPSTAKLLLKSLAILAGVGMAGYGLYKIPSVLRKQRDSLTGLADLAEGKEG